MTGAASPSPSSRRPPSRSAWLRPWRRRRTRRWSSAANTSRGPATAPPATPRRSRAARPSPAAIPSPRRWARSSRPTSRRRRRTASATTASRISPAPSATAWRPAARTSTRRCPTPPMPASPTRTSPRSTRISCSASNRSIPRRPKTALPFPFDLRPLMIGWNLLFAGHGFTPAAGASPEVQRGQYLVETLGHCSACHSPRNAMMAEESSRHLAGGTIGGLAGAEHHAGPGRRHRRLERGRGRHLPPRRLCPRQGRRGGHDGRGGGAFAPLSDR